jgi:hypothetical protein
MLYSAKYSWGMSQKGLFFALSIIVLSLVLISLPYFYAFSIGGTGHVFSGFLVNPLDGNSYLAKMYEGWRGEWKFTLPYTAEKGDGNLLFVFYLGLGHISRITGIDRIFVFHLARVLSALILFLSIYYFLNRLELKVFEQKWVFPLFVFGSGLGWLFFLFGVVTSDFWIAEAYPFLSAYTNPHFCLGLSLMLWLFMPPKENNEEQQQLTQKSFLSQWYFLFFSLLLSLISPFGVIIVILVLGLLFLLYTIPRQYSMWKNTKRINFRDFGSNESVWLLSRLIFVVIGGIPALLYYLWISHTDPLLIIWNTQNVTASPPLWDLLISFPLSFFYLYQWFCIIRTIKHFQNDCYSFGQFQALFFSISLLDYKDVL